MGQSTDGILAFGVTVEEGETPFLANEDEEIDLRDDFLAEKAGLKNPYADWPDHMTSEEWYAQNPDWDERTKAWREAVNELEAQCPIEIVTHCSGEYPLYIIALRGTVTTAIRGYPEKISSSKLMTLSSAQAIERAAQWCEENELQPFIDPHWLLASYWG